MPNILEPLILEGLTCRESLVLAKNGGFFDVIIEIDSSIIIDVCKGNRPPYSFIIFLTLQRTLLSQLKTSFFNHSMPLEEFLIVLFIVQFKSFFKDISFRYNSSVHMDFVLIFCYFDGLMKKEMKQKSQGREKKQELVLSAGNRKESCGSFASFLVGVWFLLDNLICR